LNYSIPKIDYDGARDEYLRYLRKNPGVVSVIEFGEIKYPGLSDIDWLVVFDENRTMNSDYLLPWKNLSTESKMAFQHRPIFYPKGYLDSISDFILPTQSKVVYGNHIDLNQDNSTNPLIRDITVSFEFFKRQKFWLNAGTFYNFPFIKQISILKSITNHVGNNLLSNIQELIEFEKKIDLLRNSISCGIDEQPEIDIFRKDGIFVLLKIESFLKKSIIDNFIEIPSSKKYYTKVKWSKSPVFNEKILTLDERLLAIPYAYTLQDENENSTIKYCRNKYLLINKIVSIFNKINLRDGLIGDLGFDNWFNQSLRYKLYRYKQKLYNKRLKVKFNVK
jgi:hypothetical protein